MTLSDITNKISQLTNASTNDYTNAQRLIDINLWYQKVVTMILDSQDESDFDDARQSDYPIVTAPFTLNGTDNLFSSRDFPIPVSEKVLKIKNVNITYDGVTWYKANPIDDNQFYEGIAPASAATMESTIDNRFSKANPFYDVKYNSLFVYPRASASDITNGAKIMVEWTRQIQEFSSSDLTTGTAVPGFDDPFHAMLAYGPAYEYCLAKDKPQTSVLAQTVADFEGRLRKHYGWKQQDRNFTLTPLLVDYGARRGGRFNNTNRA